ncbi:hypothetical protein [Nannocystis sp. SCPEA4]|uniref:hypothetical protein n=1 Tax=Nannocystis sp. SCPEA4 TaxID=2996787 RepID=UPI002271F8D4|nr:hypothetical protein [Nannocystis sp. SCPEA4]MCY1054672.1 hypothetical protein [Nannocystis sp. SCPEA4]
MKLRYAPTELDEHRARWVRRSGNIVSMACDDQPDANASRRLETSGLDALSRRLGPPTSRLSVAAATLVVLTWIVLSIAVMVAELLSVADSIAVPLGVIMVLCIVTSLALGVAALVEHARVPQLRGLAQAIFAVVVSGAELMIILHAYFSGFIGPHGRRLRVRGRPVLARVRARASERPSCPSGHRATVASLDEVDRAALRDYWTWVAREEHASITAFERLAVALRERGAPRSLIVGAQMAAQQEADHAARCFALASAYAGQSLEPCALVVEDTGTPTLVTLALEALIDGCLGEGSSAAEAALLVGGGDTAKAVHDTLVVIARDEAEHAALSWAVLEWCLAVGGAPVHVAVKRTLAALAPRAKPTGLTDPSASQRAHGMATGVERDAAWRAAHDVTVTRASALLGHAISRAA